MYVSTLASVLSRYSTRFWIRPRCAYRARRRRSELGARFACKRRRALERSASLASRRAARFGPVWPGGLRAGAVLRISLTRAEMVVGGPYSMAMVFRGFGETWEGPLGVGTPYAHRRSERVDLAARADGAAAVSRADSIIGGAGAGAW